ncbi:MAG: DedA family protein [Spirochaetia bacterium]|nr:DedA family protein [Spirochaetia bacterium]
MDILKLAIDFVIHIDKYLDVILKEYGILAYIILFLIIFAETGLVVTPFLPGDSLLFAIGAITARGELDLIIILFLLTFAAILGDTVNYRVGAIFKDRLLRGESIRFIKDSHIERTKEFYNDYGGKTIIIGRFIPIIRTFAPFVAGIGNMKYRQFLFYNIIGGVIWISIFTIAGYYFGNLPMIRKNFTLVIFAIIILSILPAVFEFLRSKINKNNIIKDPSEGI